MDGIKKINKTLNSIFNISLLISILIFAIGVFLFIDPTTVFNIMALFVAVLFLIPGIISIVDYIKEKNNASLITGIITILISIIIVIYRAKFQELIPFIFGIFFVINGVNRLQYALQIRKDLGVKDSKPLIMALIIMLCGIFFIVFPITIAKVSGRIAGIFLCLYALIDIANSIMVKLDIKQTKKDMKNAIIEVEAVDTNNEQ